MAIMIPDSCPAKATAGEKRAFRLFRDILPGQLHRLVRAGRRRARFPDFTLLADDFGLLVLEVKGWYAKQIARSVDSEVELRDRRGGPDAASSRPKNPIRQVREYLFA